MRIRGFVVVRLVSVLFIMSVLSPSTVYALRDKKTLNPTADAFVASEFPDWNTGWGMSLKLERVTDSEKLVFLMFDLAELPADAIIENAELRLYASDVFNNTLVGAYYCPTNDWTEEGITYSNKPTFSPDPITTANLTEADTWYEWNVTNAAQPAFKATEKKLTLVLVIDTFGSVDFHSMNDPLARPPPRDTRHQLVVLYDAPPPSSNNNFLTTLVIIVLVVAVAVTLELAYIFGKKRRRSQDSSLKPSVHQTASRKLEENKT